MLWRTNQAFRRLLLVQKILKFSLMTLETGITSWPGSMPYEHGSLVSKTFSWVQTFCCYKRRRRDNFLAERVLSHCRKGIYVCHGVCKQIAQNVAAVRLMSKLLTMNSGYRSWYRANFIAVWYARQAIPKRSLRYIYNTSKVQYIHDIKGEGHIPPNTTTYDHIRTFTSKQNKFTWY